MGTLVRITLYAPSPSEAKAAFTAAFARIAQINQELSDYLPDSELNRLCAAPPNTPVRLSDDLYRTLSFARALANETGGAFDVTLGPVIRLWREARRTHQLPDPGALGEAQSRTGYRHLILDPDKHSATLGRSHMQLDLGALGKGFAAEAALETLRSLGIPRALVAASGDLAIGDPPPGQAGWKVGIGGSGESFAQTLELHNTAVSTSGATEQFAEIGGRRYSHIIDPSTGKGLTSAVLITVIAPRGIEADALSTAISIMGEARGRALLAHHPGVQLIVSPQ